MFKQNFIRLCNSRGESPSAVCQKVGLSNAIFSQWTDETIPRRATLIKIADYLQVTVEELTANDAPNVKELEHNAPNLTPFEHDFILEYRKNPSFAAIVDAAYSAIHPQQAEDVSS